jgi:hypothetical protein
LPRGSSFEIRIAEYNAVFVETLLDKLYNQATNGTIDTNRLLIETLSHVRWFVETHFAAFPVAAEEAYRRFCWGLHRDTIVRLAPLFFRQKRAERASASYRERTWAIDLDGNQPNDVAEPFKVAQAALQQLMFEMTNPAERPRLHRRGRELRHKKSFTARTS